METVGNGIKIVVTSCLRGVYGGCVSRVTSYHRERSMSHPVPSNADPIRLTVARLHREERNSLISSVLEPNLMPFRSDTHIYHREPTLTRANAGQIAVFYVTWPLF